MNSTLVYSCLRTYKIFYIFFRNSSCVVGRSLCLAPSMLRGTLTAPSIFEGGPPLPASTSDGSRTSIMTGFLRSARTSASATAPGRALRLTKSDANRTESRRRLICGRAAKASARTIRIGWLRTFCSLSRDTESYRGREPRALSWPSYDR